MAFQQTFWSPGFGMCVDQSGIPWMVNCEQAV
jgi:PhnB protein